MNYFELFDLPVSFHPNQDVVKKKYYELSRKYHPDKVAQAAENEQSEALRVVSVINGVYKTLKNSDDTMAYILKLNGVLDDDEKYNLPPDFLMEMMDLNEAVTDYETEPDNRRIFQLIQGDIRDLTARLDTSLREQTTKFDNGDRSKEVLVNIKDFYFRKKYLSRITERIKKIQLADFPGKRNLPFQF